MGPSKYYVGKMCFAIGIYMYSQWKDFISHLRTFCNSWYNSALFGADQPWSGYYERDDSAPVVWATAQ